VPWAPARFLLSAMSPNIKTGLQAANPGSNFLAGSRLWTGGVARPRDGIDGVGHGIAPDRSTAAPALVGGASADLESPKEPSAGV